MCKVAAIIISYNPDNNLLDSVNLLINQVDKIIIVDNGSESQKKKNINLIKDIDNKIIEVITPTINVVTMMDNARIIIELLITNRKERAEQITKYLNKSKLNV